MLDEFSSFQEKLSNAKFWGEDIKSVCDNNELTKKILIKNNIEYLTKRSTALLE